MVASSFPGTSEHIEGVTWFAVESSQNPESENPACRFFEELEEAQTYAERLGTSHTCVWLAELGSYETAKGKHQDWIYFWWTHGTDWGLVYGRGKGYPEKTPNLLRDYTACRGAA